jgi:hypothetical protein
MIGSTGRLTSAGSAGRGVAAEADLLPALVLGGMLREGMSMVVRIGRYS